MSWLQAIGGRYRVGEDPLRTLRRIELLAVLLGFLLCLQLAYGALRLVAMAAPEPVAPAADSLQVPAVLSPAVVAAAERNEIVSRPLFWSSRRPVDQVAVLANPDGQPGELQGVQLVGLFGSGEQAGIIALVKGEKRRILLGDTVEGWTLKSITPYELVVSDGERTETLALLAGNVSAKAAGAGAAAVAEPGGKAKSRPGGASAPAGNNRRHGDKARSQDKAGSGYKPPAAGPAPAGNASEPAEAERTLGLGPADRGR